MKQSFRIFLLLTHILLATSSWAQSAVSELGSKKMDSLKQIADKLVGGSDAAEFTQAAFTSKRMDFLELCWATRPCMRVFLDELQEIDDTEFRDQLVLMMLRCPDRGAWLDENGGGLLGGGQDILASIMQRLIRDHLPDFPSSYERISSLERRRKLADELEIIINHKREEASKPPAAPSLAPQNPVIPAPVTLPPLLAASPKPAAPPPPLVEPEKNGHFNLALWIATGLVILTILVLLRRKQQCKRL